MTPLEKFNDKINEVSTVEEILRATVEDVNTWFHI